MKEKPSFPSADRRSFRLHFLLIASLILGSCTSAEQRVAVPVTEWFVSPITQIEGTLDEACDRGVCVDGSVMLPSGKAVYGTTDLEMPDTLGALTLTRTWTAEGRGIFGEGWATIWDSTLIDGVITGVLPGRPLQLPQAGRRIPLSDGTAISFDSDGHVVEVCEAEAVCIGAVRESDRIVLQPARVTNEGIRLELSNGRVTEAVATDGRIVRYSYSEDRLAEVQRPAGNEAYGYSDHGLLISIASPGAGRSFEYQDGRVSSMTDPLGGFWQFTAVEADVVRVMRPDGGQRTYRFTGDLLIEASDSTRGVLLRREYEGQTLRREERPLDGIVIDMLDGRKVRYRMLATDGPPLVAVYGFDQWGRITTAETASGATSYVYDGFGLSPVSVRSVTGSFDYDYDGDGLVVAATDADGYRVSIERGSNGLPVRASDGATDIEFGYDSSGRIVTQTSGGHTDSARFDALGRLVSSTTASGTETRYEYDTLGRLIRVDGPQTTELTYTAEGWLDEVSSALIGVIPDFDVEVFTGEPWRENSDGTFSRRDATGTSMTADSWGRVTRIEAGGRVVEREFDASGRLVRVLGPDGLAEVDYTAAGRVSKVVVDGVEIAVEWTGDLMTSLEMSTGVGYGFTYDRSGRLISASQGDVRWDYTYDPDGRLIGIDTPVGPLSYQWDRTGMPVGSTLPSGVSRSFRWNDGILEWVRDLDGSEIELGRDESGRVQRIRADDVATVLDLDELGRVTTYRIGDGPAVSISYGPNGVSGLSVGGSTELWSYAPTGVIEGVIRDGDRFVLDWEAPGILRSVDRDGVRLAEAAYDARGRAVEVRDDRGATVATFDWSSIGLSGAIVAGESLRIERSRDGLVTQILDGDDQVISLDYLQGVVRRVDVGDQSVEYSYLNGRLAGTSVVTPSGEATLSWSDDGSALVGFDGTVGSGVLAYAQDGVISSIELGDEKFSVEADDRGRLRVSGRAGGLLDELFTDDGRFDAKQAISAGPVAPLLALVPQELNLVLPIPATPDDMVKVALADALPQLPRPLLPANDREWANNIVSATLSMGATVSLALSAGQSIEMSLRPGDVERALLIGMVPSIRVSEVLFDRLGPGPCLLCRVVDVGAGALRSIGSVASGVAGFLVTNPVTTAVAGFAFVGVAFLSAFLCQGNIGCQAAAVVGTALAAQVLTTGELGVFRGLFETVATPIRSVITGVTTLDPGALAAGAAVIVGALVSRRLYNGTPAQSRLLQRACRFNRVPCLSYSKYPGAAGNLLAAQSAGAGRIARVNRVGVAERRQGALAGIPTRAGFDRDEAPPAFLRASNRRVTVSYVLPADNRGAGAALGSQLSAVPNGRFVVPLVVP